MNRRPAALLFVALALTGCGRLQAPRPAPGPAGPVPRDEFRGQVLGLSRGDVRALLGAPEEIRGDYWRYRGLTLDPGTGKPDADLMLLFEGGRVSEVIQHDPGLSRDIQEMRNRKPF
jgi:hypothetical protein